jgi:hypothetical protein
LELCPEGRVDNLEVEMAGKPGAMRVPRLIERSQKRCSREAGARDRRVYTVLTLAELRSFDALRRLIGMNRSQAARFLMLKEIAFAMGRHRQGRTSVCVGRREG